MARTTTLKGIMRNNIANEVRRFVEKDGTTMADVEGKSVELHGPTRDFSDWRFDVPIKVYGTPRNYSAGGWIDEQGYVNVSYITYGDGFMVSGDDLLAFKFDK